MLRQKERHERKLVSNIHQNYLLFASCNVSALTCRMVSWTYTKLLCITLLYVHYLIICAHISLILGKTTTCLYIQLILTASGICATYQTLPSPARAKT